jgi:hypothetical protein
MYVLMYGLGAALDLPFRIEQWDDAVSRVEELIAVAADRRVAMAAFTEAARRLAGLSRLGRKRGYWQIVER